jgi:Secretion system C-terminal sorting domain
MKSKILFLLLFISVSYSVFGQVYKYDKFIDQNKKWIYNSIDPSNGDGTISTFWFDKSDTLINGIKYSTLMRELKSTNFGSIGIVAKFAFLREDTIGKKVYLQPYEYDSSFCDKNEHLIIDFSMKENDTLYGCMRWLHNLSNNYDSTVNKINTISKWDWYPFHISARGSRSGMKLLSWKLDRRFFFPSYYKAPNVIWDGIGFDLDCNFHKIKFWYNFAFCEDEDCKSYSSNNDLNFYEINTYPNPVYDLLNINTLDNSIYKIYNEIGQLVLNGNLNSNQIQVSNLQKGMYFIIIENDKIYSSKFIKD